VRRLVAAALALVVFGACKVDVAVGVNTNADGSGEVRVTAVLDEDAAKRVEAAGATLRTEDLEATGWTVDEPETAEDGSVTHVLRHEFDSPAEAERILAQLTADNGAAERQAPLRDFVVTQRRSFFRTETSFRGTVDLARGAEAFSDARLQETLDGQPLGVPVEQLERQLGASFDRIFAHGDRQRRGVGAQARRARRPRRRRRAVERPQHHAPRDLRRLDAGAHRGRTGASPVTLTGYPP
jgi:hypothetical protein